MDLSQIKAFLAVAEEGSFTRASKQLNLSQPSISLKVKALEKELGTNLIIREQNNLHLSPEGVFAAEKLSTVIKDLDSIRSYFDAIKRDCANKLTIYHTPVNSYTGVENLLLLARKIGDCEIKVSTQTCDCEAQVLQQVEKNTNSIGLTSSRADSALLSSTIIDREELMLICNKDSTYHQDAIDIYQLFNEQLWLPELGSETLKVFESKIRPLGLELSDFKNGEHLSEPIMLDLVRSDEGIGIGLCNSKDTKTSYFKFVRINEFSTPYAIYAHSHIQSSAVVQNLIQSIESISLKNQDKDYPVLERSKIYSTQALSKQDTTAVRVGIQSRTIQAVVAGRAIQKLGLYESFLNELNQASQQCYSTIFKDYRSAAPILAELKSGNLDIAVAGDYAITHIANSLTAEDEKIVLIGFTSINPMGSGSRLMIPHDAGSISLTGLSHQSIQVPLLSTAHGSLLYNLQRNGILDSTKVIDLELNPKSLNGFVTDRTKSLACFTPFDHFLESEYGYVKMEDEMSMPFSFYGVIARLNFITQHPDAVVAFLKSNLCSNHWFQTTPSAIKHLSKWTGVKESIVNQIIGERQGNDCHYMHDTTIRKDWISEFTSTLFIQDGSRGNQSSAQSPLVIEDFLKQARSELALR